MEEIPNYRRTILVVDDQRDHRDIAVALLRYAHYETLEAASVGEAERLMQIQRPDLILLDISMPKKNGLEWVFELRQNKYTATIPVLAYTSFRDVYTDELHRLGVPVIDKSEPPERFLDRIDAALKDRQQPDEPPASA